MTFWSKMSVIKNSHFKPVRSNRAFDVVSLITGCIVCLFHILGISVPGWWILEEVDTRGSTVQHYFGVWSTKTCSDGVCFTEAAKMSEERAWLIGPAMLILIAGVLMVSVVALLAVTVFKSWGVHPRQLCVLLSGGSGGIVLLSVLIFVKKKAGLLPSTAPDTSHGELGWTLIITTVGAVLSLVNAIIIGIGVGKNFRSEKPPLNQLDMEINVKGSNPAVRTSVSNFPSSGDQGSKWQIQKKQQKQQMQRRESGMVFSNPDFEESNERF